MAENNCSDQNKLTHCSMSYVHVHVCVCVQITMCINMCMYIYIYIFICVCVHIYIYIRRPRQTQGGARQGIILLTLVSDYYCSRRSSNRPLGFRSVLQGHWRAAAATGAAGGFYVSFYKKWYKKLVENYYCFSCFSRVSEGTLGSFWARFWRRSVLQGHCVSLSSSVRFQLREEEQQQQQEQQEGSMSHYVSLYKQRYKNWSKTTIVFLGFQKGR